MFPERCGVVEGEASCSGARALPLSATGDAGAYPGMASSSRSSSSSSLTKCQFELQNGRTVGAPAWMNCELAVRGVEALMVDDDVLVRGRCYNFN